MTASAAISKPQPSASTASNGAGRRAECPILRKPNHECGCPVLPASFAGRVGNHYTCPLAGGPHLNLGAWVPGCLGAPHLEEMWDRKPHLSCSPTPLPLADDFTQ